MHSADGGYFDGVVRVWEEASGAYTYAPAERAPSIPGRFRREMEETTDVSRALHGNCHKAFRLVSKII